MEIVFRGNNLGSMLLKSVSSGGSLLGALAVLVFSLEATKHGMKSDFVERVHRMGREKSKARRAGQEGKFGDAEEGSLMLRQEMMIEA